VLFPEPESGDPKLAVLLTTSGGLTGGDELRVTVTALAKAQAAITTQAAEKIYRSLGSDVRIDVALAVEPGAYLEYLPQETILFEGARLARRNRAAVAPSGTLLACEMVVFGRVAHGERLTQGRCYDAWQISRGDALVWSDALALEGDIGARLRSPFGFAGAEALATALYVGDDAERHLPLARKLAQSSACRGGASLVQGVLVARFLGAPAQEVRRALVHYISFLRAAAGWPARLPRNWSI
jgi:urease accessory protein